MKKWKLIAFLTLALSCYSFSNDYRIGDRIALEISGLISEELIREELKDYKIIELYKEEDKFNLIFTSYEIGEKSLQFGNKVLKFKIVSSLNNEEKDIYPQLWDEKNRYIEKDYPYSAILSLLFGLTALMATIVIHLIDRAKNPYLLFKKGISKVDSENWKELISLELRKYIDRVYSTNFCGGDYIAIHSLDSHDIEFIKLLDYLKFSRSENYECDEYKKKAIEIVQKLRKEKIESV